MMEENHSQHSNSKASTGKQQQYLIQNYINFFSYHQIVNNSLYYLKDPVFDYGFILTNPLMVIESKTYTPRGQILIEQEHLDCIENKHLHSFISDGTFFCMLYQKRQIIIYSLTKNYFEMTPYQIIDLKLQNTIQMNEGEAIVQIQTIKNEHDIPFFIIVTNRSRVMFLTIYLKPFNYQIYEYKPRSSLVSSVFSYFTSGSNEGDNFIKGCDILNPFNYTKMVKGNKKNNCLIVLSNTSLKMYNFDVLSQSIDPEMTIDQPIKNSILSKVNDNSSSFTILSSDVYYNLLRKVYQVSLVIRTSSYQFYLVQLNIENNNSVNNIQLLNISQYYSMGNVTCTYLIMNKYKEEGILISDSFLIYFPGNSIYVNQFKYAIKGINPLSSPQDFTIDVLTDGNGVINIKVFDYNFYLNEKTDVFLSKFPYDRSMLQSNILNTTMHLNHSIRSMNPMLNNRSMLNSNINNSMIDHMNTSNLSNSFQMNPSFSQQSNTNYSIIQFLKEKFNEYTEKNLITEASRQEMHNLFQSTKIELIYQSIQAIITKKTDDDTLNIEVINRNSSKAEFVIVEYLEDKLALVSNFFDFLCHYDIFSTYEQSQHNILILLLNCMEKLIVMINIRRKENKYLEIQITNQANRFKVTEDDIITIFLEMFYRSMKEIIVPNMIDNRPFSKQYLYGKLNHINMSFLGNFFENYQNAYNTSTTENKIILTRFMIDLVININMNLMDHHKVVANRLKVDDKSIAVILACNRDVFWCMSKRNLDDNLRQVYYNAIELNRDKANYLKKEINDEILFSYSELILYLYSMYYSQNTSSHDKRDYYELKKKIIGLLINEQTYEKCLGLAKDNNDYYTISFICYQWNQYKELKEYIKNHNNPKAILFILKQILLLDIMKINSFIPNREGYISFDFFDTFSDYKQEISTIVNDYPKLKSYFNLYLNQLSIKDNDLNNKVPIEVLTPEINSVDNVSSILKIEKTLSVIDKTYLVTRNQENISEQITRLNNSITEENYAIVLANIARHFYYDLNKKNIFDEIPKIIEKIMTTESQILSNAERYFISIHFLQLAIRMGKIDNDNAKQMITEIYKIAIEYDYVNIKAYLGKCQAKTMEKISDVRRNQIEQCSIIGKIVNSFNDTKEDFVTALQYFYNQYANQEINLSVDQDDLSLRQEFFMFLSQNLSS